jgi:hypothetical protein
MSKQAGRLSQGANDFLAPYAPTGVSASDVGTGRDYNNGAATVTFTADPRNAATSFTATSSPGGFTGTASSSPITVTGLQSGVSYTFTVTATNSYGTSSASAASASMTATTVPATPAAPDATAQVNQDYVTWTAPADGGKVITGYVLKSSDSPTYNTTSTNYTVPETANTAQTYQVLATNANGNSAYSANSNQVTTLAPSFFSPPFFPPSFFAPPFFPPAFFAPPFFPPAFFAPPFFPPAFFAPPSFFAPPFFPPAFFSPPSFCIDEDTLLEVVGENDTIVLVPAKDITVGTKIWSYTLNGLLPETECDPLKWSTDSLVGSPKTQSVINHVTEGQKDVTVYFNGDITKRFSLEHAMIVKRNGVYALASSGGVMVGDTLVDTSNGELNDVTVTEVSFIDEPRKVYHFDASEDDIILAGNLLTHNGKARFFY